MQDKKFLIVAIAAVFVAFLFFSSNNPAKIDVNAEQDLKSFNLIEIAQHNTEQDCWLLIDGNVYDVTSYVESHPGGANQIVSNCGTDSTEAFSTKGGKDRDHSNSAKDLLKEYLIGTLKTG